MQHYLSFVPTINNNITYKGVRECLVHKRYSLIQLSVSIWCQAVIANVVHATMAVGMVNVTPQTHTTKSV